MIRIIYTFFVGLFLAIFIGMGINVFYPAPAAPQEPFFTGKELSLSEQAQEKAFQVQQRAYMQKMYSYNRTVSIIALICSVVVLTIALVFASRLGVIADGILLGGVFTLLYGIGRGMDTNSDKYRFAIAAVGLIITLVLGFIKFVPKRKSIPAAT